ncbi:MAG: ABC transporter permease [Deltaproteobacteria bacterium]|uniref:Cell division protein FtsX n=1 Tax=Candidatus Zymogenus saltonus TaxID=2844893 RepID=A0A9D8PNV4_9DELT|nr:ABC transporter permease [Candidatus Zymogenus saltonus]
MGEEVQITAYLADFLSDEAADGLEKDILEIKEVEGATYISKEDALKYLGEIFSGQGDVLEGLSKNPLPASFEVKLKKRFRTPEDVALVAKKIERMNGVDDVVFAREWLSRFYEVQKIVKVAGIIIGVVLSVAVIAIIAITIKLTLYAKRDEIDIMKLVGGTNSFIKIPMIFEGMMQGFLGSVIAVGALFLTYRYFMEHYYKDVGLFFGGIEVNFFDPEIIIYFFIFGISLGLFGSIISFGRMLKT